MTIMTSNESKLCFIACSKEKIESGLCSCLRRAEPIGLNFKNRTMEKLIKINLSTSLTEIRRSLAMLPRAEETDALISMTDEQLEEKFINRESLTLSKEILEGEYNSFVAAIIFLMVGTDGLNGK